MKTLQQLVLIVCVLIQSIGYSQANNLEKISNKYNEILKEQNKGIGLLVKKDGQIQTSGIGNFNLNENSVFNIGSATKTFTAILLMQEVEKGTIKLNDSMGMYLSPIKNVDGALTIETLLKHESGLAEVAGRNLESIFLSKNDSVYKNPILSNIGKNDPKMVGKFEYTNTNYLLLGKIIEKITDQYYFDVVRERIFQPLQMNNTYSYLHKNLPNLATPYHNGKDATEHLDYRFYAMANAAGSIASTLLDMEKFYTALFETEMLLKKETVDKMLTPEGEQYGLGIMKETVDGINYYGHGGNNLGYAFRNGYNPDTKMMYLIFTNSGRVPLSKSISDDIISYLNNKKIDENFASINMDKYKNYIGKYLLKEANLTLEIVAENNKLFMVVEVQGVKSELVKKDEITLFDTTVGVTLQIIEDDKKVLKFNQNGFETMIKRIE